VRRACRALMACVVLTLGVVLFAVDAGDAGAIGVSTTLAPWDGSPISPSGTNVNGECNENFAFVGTWSVGYKVQIACQYEMPATASPLIVSPTVPVHQAYITCCGGNPPWASGSVAGYWGDGFLGLTLWGSGATGTCAPTQTLFSSTASEPGVYLGLFQPGTGIATHCTVGGLSTGSSTWYGGSSTNGLAWSAYGQVTELQIGAAATASNGKSYKSVSMMEQVTFNGDPTLLSGALTAGDLHHPVYEPWDLGHSSPCPSLPVGATNDRKYEGSLETAAMQPDELLAQVSGSLTGYTGSAWTGLLRLDAVTCSTTYAWGVALPARFYQGGSATVGAAPCTLISVSQPPIGTFGGSSPGISMVAGTTYGFTFITQGAAAYLAVDPVDGDPPGPPDDGPGGYGSAVTGAFFFGGDYLGADTAVAAVNGDGLTTVSVTPTNSGSWDPQFYCGEATGSAFPLGDALGAPSGAGGDVTTSDPATADCFAAAGWSLTNPVSWVLGALHDAQCVVVVLFVPSGSALSSLTGLFGVTSDSPSSALPAGAWLGGMAGLVSTWPAAAVGSIKTAADSGSCSVGPTISLDGHVTGVCDELSATATALGSGWTVVDGILTAVFLLMVGLAVFHLLRRVLSGSE
jgi:hypothetical protein